jgi:hypothetical protein
MKEKSSEKSHQFSCHSFRAREQKLLKIYKVPFPFDIIIPVEIISDEKLLFPITHH